MIKACVKCRREGEKLLLKGERCLTPKCSVAKRPYGPGQHGQSFRGKVSEFGKQLREKQKAKRIYGMGESQFAGYAEKASQLEGNTTENLMRLLECRLDNLVYRLGFAVSRSQARQLVSHGLIKVNSKKVTIPSFQVKEGFTIEPKVKEKYNNLDKLKVVNWLELDGKKVVGKLTHVPSREEIDTPVNESLIVEYYTR